MMRTRIKMGVGMIFIYIILILFTIYMTNRIEMLDVYSDTNNRISIGVQK